VGDAYWDAVNKYMVLTQAQNGQQGILWLNPEITGPFEVQFSYKTGGGTGADGIVFMFYKNKRYSPGGGERLAFQQDIGTPVPGYGIEFDTFKNSFDPSADHIALIKDMTSNHFRLSKKVKNDAFLKLPIFRAQS
jgi:hypothetical protein